MLVTDISLCQFYREISKRAKNKNYVWIISLIARHADAKEMYEKLEQDWTSIDNLTNDKILFVFSTNLISNSNSFFHTSISFYDTEELTFVRTCCMMMRGCAAQP